MKRNLVLVTMLLVIMMVTVVAQSAEPQTKPGSKFLYYGFSGLDNIGISGSYIGGGYFFKQDVAVFGDVSFGFKNTDPGDGGDELGDDTINLDLGVEWFAMKKGSVGLYLGPQLTFSRTSADAAGANGLITTTENTVGFALSISAEWWVTDVISFWGGTHVGYTSMSGSREHGTVKTEYSATRLGFLDDAAKIGIGFYF